MKNLKGLFIVTLSLFVGCRSTINVEKEVNRYIKNKTIETRLKVIGIKEYGSVYRLRVLDKTSIDTMIIASLKDNFYNKHKLNKPSGEDRKRIIVGNDYEFTLLPINTRVDKFVEYGYIIVENDTLWTEKHYKNTPKSYVAQNAIGLSIYEKVDSTSLPNYPVLIIVE